MSDSKGPTESRNVYDNPLVNRYSSKEMSYLWSPQKKFSTWRQLWIALAIGEKELGLNISDQQIDQMQTMVNNINFEYAEAKEKEFRHDVMSHVHAFGHQCPAAAPIIHLGATSCYVTDNGELVQLKESLLLIQQRLLNLIKLLGKAADDNKALPTLGFTHYQPAQLTTVGKRFSLYLQDFVMDFEALSHLTATLPFRGVKGTTGTQASFLELFEGDHSKVKALNDRVTKLMGFSRSIPVSGQTYTRKIDFQIVSVLSGIAQSAHKMCTDLRLLANLKEVEEPFGESQIGSSAMAYKRNPMRCERVCSIARFVISLTANTAHTHAVQWFERTLDDSANRRLTLPESFLGVETILSICANVIDGIQIWPFVIRKHVMTELPFMATEIILMNAVKGGGDRQVLHEAIREHSMQAGRRVKEEGADNDLLQRIAADPLFACIHDSLSSLTEPSLFIGRSKEQVEEYLEEHVNPLLSQHAAILSKNKTSELVV